MAANPALLQPFVGIERLAQRLRVPAHQFTLLRFRARRLRVESLELVLHLRACRVRRINQRTVKPCEFLFDGGEVRIQGFFRRIKRRLQISGQTPRGQLTGEALPAH